MKITHRRKNLVQSYLLSDRRYATAGELQACGAYGSAQSIQRAMLRLKYQGAVDIFREGRRVSYRFTPHGLVAMGHVPGRVGP